MLLLRVQQEVLLSWKRTFQIWEREDNRSFFLSHHFCWVLTFCCPLSSAKRPQCYESLSSWRRECQLSVTVKNTRRPERLRGACRPRSHSLSSWGVVSEPGSLDVLFTACGCDGSWDYGGLCCLLVTSRVQGFVLTRLISSFSKVDLCSISTKIICRDDSKALNNSNNSV